MQLPQPQYLRCGQSSDVGSPLCIQEHLTRVLARLYAPHGVRVNSVMPAWVDTEAVDLSASIKQVLRRRCRWPPGRSVPCGVQWRRDTLTLPLLNWQVMGVPAPTHWIRLAA